MKHELSLDMKHGHEHAALTWTCSMDLVMQHGLGHAEANEHAPWMLECRMADKKLSSGIVSYPLFYSAYSGIVFSEVPPVTD